MQPQEAFHDTSDRTPFFIESDKSIHRSELHALNIQESERQHQKSLQPDVASKWDHEARLITYKITRGNWAMYT